MEYLIRYDATTGEILERRPQTGVTYPAPMHKPYIKATEEQFQSIINGNKRVNPSNKIIEDIPVVPPTLEELKFIKKTQISGDRYKAERAGMLFNGHPIATDDVGQNKITGAVLSAMEDGTYTIPEWLCADGTFISLSNEDILELGRALRDHVQNKFRINKDLFDAIDAAATPIELEAIEWSDDN